MDTKTAEFQIEKVTRSLLNESTIGVSKSTESGEKL